MFKLKLLSVGIITALLLTLVPASATFAKGPALTPEQQLNQLGINTQSGGPPRAYECDGNGHVIELTEASGQVKFMPKTITKAEFMAQHTLSAVDEAKIVHTTPVNPVFIDGVLYQPEQIHLFDGRRLGFTVGKDGQLCAFTSDAALEKFEASQILLAPDKTAVVSVTPMLSFSYFCENVNYGGNYIASNQGAWFPNLADLPYSLDNRLSSEQINSPVTSATLFDGYNYGGDYFDRPAGTQISNLGNYGWNDKASSLIVWWF
jgi:hypothetical protein